MNIGSVVLARNVNMTAAASSTLLDSELIEVFHGEMTPKFLATRDPAGEPNVVPIISLDAVDERTLVFGELMIWKTRDNLAADPRVGIAIVTEDLRSWTIRGRFREFVESGPYVDRMNAKEMFRYNAYVRISRAAVIDVEAVTSAERHSKLGVAAGLLCSKAGAYLVGRQGGGTIPPRVAEKFARTRAIKVLAFPDATGHPTVAPTFSLLPTESNTMVFGMSSADVGLGELTEGGRMAASVITMDAIAYQVKGVYAGSRLAPLGRVGQLSVDEVYSASPPLCGRRIEPATTVP